MQLPKTRVVTSLLSLHGWLVLVAIANTAILVPDIDISYL